MDQQFSLHWNNYLRQITEAFDILRSDKDFVDVTLSCQGKKIKAHKMLLSACSAYFKDVFKDNPCQHPVIVFKDVKYEDLNAIIDFMYKGEVVVSQEQLESFLRTAELLEVKGLTEGEDEPSSVLKNQHEPVPKKSIPRVSEDTLPQKKRKYSDPTSEPKTPERHQNLTISDESCISIAVPTLEKQDLTFTEEVSENEKLNSSFELNVTCSSPKRQKECSKETMREMLLGKPDTLVENGIQNAQEGPENLIKEGEDSCSKAEKKPLVEEEADNNEEPMEEDDFGKEEQENEELKKEISKKNAIPIKVSEINRMIPESMIPKLEEQPKKGIKLPKGLTVTVSEAQPFEDNAALRSEDAKTPIHEEGHTQDEQSKASGAGEGPEAGHEAPELTPEQTGDDEPPEFDYYGCEICRDDAKHPDPKAFTHKCPICPCICYCAHLLKEHMKVIHGWFNVQRRFNQY